MINADLAQLDARQRQQSLPTTSIKVEVQHEDEIHEESRDVEKQHEQTTDESDKINIEDIESMKTQNKMCRMWGFCAVFFGMVTK